MEFYPNGTSSKVNSSFRSLSMPPNSDRDRKVDEKVMGAEHTARPRTVPSPGVYSSVV